MTGQRHRRRTGRSSSRRGVAALFVLICLSFATVVAALLMKASLAERTYASRLELTHQADWLVEAGVDRAAAQLARSASYAGETWPISAAHLDGSRTAVVRIEVKRDVDPKLRSVHVTAEIHGAGGTTFEATKEARVPVAPSKNSHGETRLKHAFRPGMVRSVHEFQLVELP